MVQQKSVVVPTDWDHSVELVNINSSLLDACGRRIAQQCTFDKKPLGVAVCYGCGHLLWSCVDGAHTFLVNKPSGKTEDDAPASAYLRTVPNCTASFVYTERGNSTKERWYCCPYCKSNQIPSDQQVGHVLDASLNAKPIDEWDMSFPVEVQSLANSVNHLFFLLVQKPAISMPRIRVNNGDNKKETVSVLYLTTEHARKA